MWPACLSVVPERCYQQVMFHHPCQSNLTGPQSQSEFSVVSQRATFVTREGGLCHLSATSHRSQRSVRPCPECPECPECPVPQSRHRRPKVGSTRDRFWSPKMETSSRTQNEQNENIAKVPAWRGNMCLSFNTYFILHIITYIITYVHKFANMIIYVWFNDV